MLRAGEHFFRRSLLHKLALLEHGDPVGDLRDHAEIMGDEENRRSLLAAQVVDQLEHLRLRGHVEGRSRLVGDEELRLERKGHGDHHPLALAAGELVRIGLGDQLGVRQVHLAEEVEHAAARAPPA